jgi:hypothetical protein
MKVNIEVFSEVFAPVFKTRGLSRFLFLGTQGTGECLE